MTTNIWTGAAGGDNWLTAGNWSLGQIPTTGESIENVSGNIDINAGQIAEIQGSFLNDGVVDLDSAGTDTDFVVVDDDILSGDGAIQLSDNANNRIYSTATGSVFTNAGNTIAGAGQIFGAGDLSVINQSGGAFAATYADAALAVSNLSFTNQGVVEAIGGATLSFAGALANISNDPTYAYGSTLSGGQYVAVDPATGGPGSGSASAIAISGAVGGVVAREITTLAATVSLTGAGSELTSAGVSLSSSLLDLAPNGVLNLYYGANSSTRQIFDAGPDAIEVAGLVNVDGAAFEAAALTIGYTGAVSAIAYQSQAGTLSVTGAPGIVNGGVLTATGGTIADAGDFANDGYFYVDTNYSFGSNRYGGSSVTINGALINACLVQIGDDNLGTATTVSVGGVDNAEGEILLTGASAPATLSVFAGTAGFGIADDLIGNVFLQGNAVVSFGDGGQIKSVIGNLELDGSGATVIDAGGARNSALAGLTTISGDIDIRGDALTTTSTGLTNQGYLEVDANHDDGDGRFGGSIVVINGTLNNAYVVDIGDVYLNTPTSLTVGVVNNVGGTIDLTGTSFQAALEVTGGVAGFGVSDEIIGDVYLEGNALISFAGGGEITDIVGHLELDGAEASIADAGGGANSAMTSLATVDGVFDVRGVSLTTASPGLAINGELDIDADPDYADSRFGGSDLAVNGSLTNIGAICIGGAGLGSATLVTVGAVDNTSGTINLTGSTILATLDITNAAAGFGVAGEVVGAVNLRGAALVEFAGTSQITDIVGNLRLDGAGSRVAEIGAPNVNSALTGLTTISGTLDIRGDAVTTKSPGLTNIGALNIDALYDDGDGHYGGSTVIIGGALTNLGAVTIGDRTLALPALATAGGLANSGVINLWGSAMAAATLTVSGSAANSGAMFANAYADIEASGTYVQSATGSLMLGLAGTTTAQFATLSATGGLWLMGGALRADLEGITLAAGQAFILATFTPGALTGLFRNLSVSKVSGNGVYDPGVSATLSAGLRYDDAAGAVELDIINTPTTQAETWTAAAGSWSTATNWSNGAPTFYSNVTIGSLGAVTLAADATIDSLTINAANLLTTSAGTDLTVGGALNLASGATITGGGEVAIGGGGSIAGAIRGGGTLVFDGGATFLASLATLSIANWIVGGGTTTIGGNVGFSGSFNLGAGAALTVSGGYLNLQGPATFINATINGANRVITRATSQVSGLTIGGAAQFQNSGILTQDAGNVTVGDNAGNIAALLNAATGAYAIADDSGIGHGASSESTFTNQGAFSKTGGVGTSMISVSFIDTGSVTATSGTLAFTGPSNSFAGAIAGAGGAVLFAGGNTTLNSGTTATVSNLSEAGPGTIVTLLENLNYGGTFTLEAGSGFNVGAGEALTLTGTSVISGDIGGSSALDILGATATLASGGGIFTSAWTVAGTSTELVVNENFTFQSAFTLNSGATVTVQGVAGGYFYLTGRATIANATIDGFNRFVTGSATAVSGLTIGGTARFENKSFVIQNGGGVTVGDAAGDVASLLNSSGAIYAITDDSGIDRGSSAPSLFTNQGMFEKTNGSGTSTVSVSFTNSATVKVSSGTLAFTGPSNSFTGAITGAGGTVAFAGGSTSLKSGTTVTVSNLSETGAGTLVSLLENLGYGGVFDQGAAAVLGIAADDTLTLSGDDTLSGEVNNSGALDLAGGGSTAINPGATLYVSTWAILGSGTTVTANTGINYAGTFSEAAGDTFTLSGGYLLLSGNDTFSGGAVNGSKILYTEGNTSVSGLTIGGAAEWENTKDVNQNGGNVTIGDATGGAATLFNTSTGVYAITDDSGIGIGASTASSIINQGLFEKSGGTGGSTIAPTLTNSKTVLVSSGVLELKGAVAGTGADTISGASTLEFDSSAALTQTIGFTGAGGTLFIQSPGTFSSATNSSAPISGFDTVGTGDSIKLAGPWTFLDFVDGSGGTSGSLTLAGAGNDVALTLRGNYNASLFHASAVGSSTLITYG